MSGILTYVNGTSIDQKGYRMVKVEGLGGADIQNISEVSPAGIDSCPHPDNNAVYLNTASKEVPVCLGYLNEGAKAEPGAVRLYTSDQSGEVKFYLWLHPDGTLDIGGKADNAVRYAPLEAGIKAMAAAIDAEHAKIATALGTVGVTYTPAQLQPDISGAKITEIKTI